MLINVVFVLFTQCTQLLCNVFYKSITSYSGQFTFKVLNYVIYRCESLGPGSFEPKRSDPVFVLSNEICQEGPRGER